MPTPLFLSLALSFSLLLSGCLFESGKDKAFRVYVSGYAAPVYARQADGEPSRALGLGVEDVDPDALELDAFPYDAPQSDTGVLVLQPGSFVIRARHEPYTMTLRRDSTFVRRYIPEEQIPYTDAKTLAASVTSYRGFPCRFARPQGYQWGPGGPGDTVRLVFSEVRRSFATDSLRLALRIDSAASTAADARVNLTGRPWVYGSVEVTCP